MADHGGQAVAIGVYKDPVFLDLEGWRPSGVVAMHNFIEQLRQVHTTGLGGDGDIIAQLRQKPVHACHGVIDSVNHVVHE